MLEDNLRELYAAACEGRELVADRRGERLYVKGSGWGWYYSYFGGKGPQLQAAIEKTAALFKERCEEIRPQVEAYRKKISELLEGKRVGKWQESCEAMLLWEEDSRPFLKELFRKRNKKLLEWVPEGAFEAGSELLLTKEERGFLLWDETGLKEIPKGILAKLLDKKGLWEGEKRRLKEWIEKIENAPVQPVHAALAGLFDDPLPVEAILVEEAVEADRETTCFHQADPEQVRWQKSLKEGAVIDGIKLGRALPKRGEEGRDLRVFEIAGNDEEVFVTAHNRALLRLKEHFFQHRAYGVRPAAFNYIDPKGRYARVEKLWIMMDLPLSKDLLEPLCKALENCISQKFTPADLKAHYIGFNSSLLLRSTKMSDAVGWVDYHFFEKFAYEAARGDPELFLHIKMESGLERHEAKTGRQQRKFYLSVIRCALFGSRYGHDSESLCKQLHINFPGPKEQGDALTEEIGRHLKKKEKECREEDPEEFLNSYKKTLFQKFQDFHHPVSFLPDISGMCNKKS